MSLSTLSFVRHLNGLKRYALPMQLRSLSSTSAPGTKVHNLKFTPHAIFTEGMKFEELNSSPELTAALNGVGLTTPTEIQAKSFEVVRNGSDTIIGGETGSGKTLAYMLPLIQQCLDSEGCKEPLQYSRAVILAPSKDLCRQIMNMTEGIFSNLRASGNNISIEFVANSTSYWPFSKKTSPYFLVTTPAIFANYLRIKSSQEPHGIMSFVQHIVLDEADMLLDGSASKDVSHIYEVAKVARRERIREGLLAPHQKTLQTILSAATIPSKGKLSVRKFVERQFPLAAEIRLFNMHKHHPCIQQEFISCNEDTPITDSTLTGIIESIKATLRSEVERAGNGVSVKDSLDNSMLENELNHHNHSVMIFVNTAQMAGDLAGALRTRYLIDCVEYHANLPQLRKALNLEAFQKGTQRILVCTDSAARGFDLPHVRHVIQAEFALNVVQHQHRVGRASRAGRVGYATNFYGPLRTELVQSILGETKDLSNVEVEDGQDADAPASTEPKESLPSKNTVLHDYSTIERSFSRRRGFRNSIKKAIRREKEAAAAADAGDSTAEENCKSVN